MTYYSVFRLKRFDEFLVYLYLLCFVYHRYQRLHDNLILSLIHNVRQYTDEAKAAAKERVYKCRTEGNEKLQKAGQVLKLFTDDSIAENTPFSKVQAKAFSILERQKLDFIADHITINARFDETAFQWEHVDELSHQFKRNLRPVLSAVDFDASLAQNALIEAVHFLKTMFQKGKSLGQYPPDMFPTRFIPANTKRYLYGQDSQGRKQFLVDRYEFLVYRLLHNGLLAGDIFCPDSVRFRSFEDDLIDDQKWQEKGKLIDLTALTILWLSEGTNLPVMCSIFCSIIRPTFNLKCIPPTRTEPMRSILPSSTCSATNLPHDTRIYTTKSVNPSMDSNTPASTKIY